MAVISHGSSPRGRLPPGPHRLTSEQVAENQRGRLIDAIVRTAGESGYTNTTVADIIESAGVSRKTFYAHYADRDELLLAAFDATSPTSLEEIRAASRRSSEPTRQMEAVMRRLSRQSRRSPAALGLALVDIAAVSPSGVERRVHLMEDFGELIGECLRTDGESSTLPPTLARALAGAIHRTLDAYLRTGRGEQMTVLALELARWVRGYHPVPSGLTTSTPSSPAWSQWLVGGRAPGTLTLAPDGYRSQPGKRTAFTLHANRERILDAVAQLNAGQGYVALTAQSIAEHAGLSERAFLAQFASKDEAVAAAVEVGHMKGQAIVDRAHASSPDWPTGVRYAVQAWLDFLASEPYFTRLAFLDAPLAGPEMVRRMHEHAGAYARLLLDGAPQRRRPAPIAPEAIAHGLFELAFHHAALDTVAELPSVSPEAVYLALAPFLGGAEAAKVAA